MFAARGQTPQALERFSQALKRDPRFFPAHLARGDQYLGQRDYDRARAEFQKAVELAPRSGTAQVKLGMVLQAKGLTTEAERAYRAAVAAEPRLAVAYNNLAWLAAERKSNLDQALKWARRAAELAPRAAQFKDTLGWVHRARGEHPQALAALKEAAALDPKSAEALYHLGVVHAEQKNRAAATEALKRALALSQDFPGADQARRLLAELGRR